MRPRQCYAPRKHQQKQVLHMQFPGILRAIITLAIMACPPPSTAQEIAITLDDLPYLGPSRTSPAEGLRIVQNINEALKKHDITATGFVVGRQINRKSRSALQAFVDAGHSVANHSWSHPDYDTLTTKAFRDETARTDRALSPWMSGPKYYRFPYLREGKTEASKTAATQVLADLGYLNVPVSIDNDEWRYNQSYVDARAQGQDAAAQHIAALYIAHMQDRTAHFQQLSQAALGRDVKHILLLHMNKINADHLGTLLDWYASQGWAFITVEDAMKDPLYSAPDIYAGPRGLSQIERVIGQASD